MMIRLTLAEIWWVASLSHCSSSSTLRSTVWMAKTQWRNFLTCQWRPARSWKLAGMGRRQAWVATSFSCLQRWRRKYANADLCNISAFSACFCALPQYPCSTDCCWHCTGLSHTHLSLRYSILKFCQISALEICLKGTGDMFEMSLETCLKWHRRDGCILSWTSNIGSKRFMSEGNDHQHR